MARLKWLLLFGLLSMCSGGYHERTLFVSPDADQQQHHHQGVLNTVTFRGDEEADAKAMGDLLQIHQRMRRDAGSSATTSTTTTARIPLDDGKDEKKIIPKVIISPQICSSLAVSSSFILICSAIFRGLDSSQSTV